MIENELKYVLDHPNPKEFMRQLSHLTVESISQGYLENGARIRKIDSNIQECTFTQKFPVDNKVVEVETKLSIDDYTLLTTQVSRSLNKIRYSSMFENELWVIDFFLNKDDTYFIMSEVEMEDGKEAPNIIPPCIMDNLIYCVDKDDNRFANWHLCDIQYSKNLLATIKQKI